MKSKLITVIVFLLLILIIGSGASAEYSQNSVVPAPALAPIGTAFTYQGHITDTGNPANGSYNLAFKLYNDASAETQVGSTVSKSAVTVLDGYFTVELDFGDWFDGTALWLEIEVQGPGDPSFTVLSPRQPLNPTPYAINADKLDGFDASELGVDYQNVIIGAKSGGEYTSVQAAIDSIADASASNRYLIWVAPGVYSEAVMMKQFVDIQGSGELATKITASGSTTHTIATVLGADDAELRFLTVENTGGAEYAVAIYNDNASPTLTHVTLIASGAQRGHGIYNNSSSPTMTEMVISVSASGASWNYGVLNQNNSLPTMRDLTISVSGGGTSGTNYGVRNESSYPTMMDVTISSKNNYGNVGVANDSSGPTMMDMTITASGGGYYNTGVYNSSSSSPTMINVIASGSGGDYGRGVHSDNSELTMRNVTSTGSDGVFHNRGLWLVHSSAMIQNSTISASGTAGIGVVNEAVDSSYTVRIDHCQITGSVNTIRNDAEYTTYVGASLLSGGTVNANGGTVICAGVYDETYTFSASGCP
ncbi:MAG: hypothetical protein E4G99_07585 [Anaerolineales bacterium]|nr:MAG: hypothetical protein E4G99_07585 [Anaerolineales bacterium]